MTAALAVLAVVALGLSALVVLVAVALVLDAGRLHGPDAERVILLAIEMFPNAKGLDLIKASNGRLPRGALYVKLAQMEDRGLIESDGLPDGQRQYRITPKGLASLKT